MAAGWPTKANYATGDVLTATNMNDLSGTVNYLDPTSATDGQVLTRDAASAGKVKWAAAASVATSYGFTAGKNRIINGDFFINQRSFTSNTTNLSYNFDRWYQQQNGGTVTVTPQNFTAGTAPVTGYEGKTFCRIDVTGQSTTSNYALLAQKIEDVRTFANQSVTISFWAKSASGTPKIGVSCSQSFGSGGSPSADVDSAGSAVTISTTWTRYTVNYTIPSISGKTIGTTANTSYLTTYFWLSAGSSNATQAGSIGIQTNTFDIWGVQIEAGSSATSFQTATGTIQGELAACQRYYWRVTDSSTGNNLLALGTAISTTAVLMPLAIKSTLRANPTSVDYSNIRVSDGPTGTNATSVDLYYAETNYPTLRATVASGLTQYRPYMFFSQSGTTGYIGVSAEL